MFNLSQLITNPACFKKGCTPSLVDVILTNQKNMCFNIQNIPTGISDCHNLISVTMQGKVQTQQQKNISYRSYTKFDVDIFNSELNQVAFPDIENIETSEEVNNAYTQYQYSFIHVLSKHAPVKTRRPRKKSPFLYEIRVITKLPNSEQSYKGKVKIHNYIKRQNQSTTGKL